MGTAVSKPLSAIVVGGGIGGVAAAVALEKVGAKVTVLEQASEISDVGAGVWITANGVKALEFLGAHDYVRETSNATQSQHYLGFDDGRRLIRTELGERGRRRYGAPSYLVHRADLLAALSDRLGPSPRVGSRVVSLEHTSSGATVTVESGERFSADLVIGADGLKSVVRQELFGIQVPHFSGQVAWRALVPFERIAGLGLEPDSQHCWFGDSRAVVAYPLRHDLIYNFVGFVPAHEVERESWLRSGDVDELRRSFSGACTQLNGIVNAIDEAFITGLYFREPLDKWTVKNVALLGDAAHPTLPTIGQGATMALEDAVSVAQHVSQTGRQSVSGALEDYASHRRDRTVDVLTTSRTNAEMMTLADPAAVAARDQRFRAMEASDPLGGELYGWLWSYDPVSQAV